jgi:hypothetical protein
MVLDPALFRDYQDLKIGDRVKFVSDVWGEGEGIVVHIWLGIEEMCDVRKEGEDRSFSLCRAIGDKIEKLMED